MKPTSTNIKARYHNINALRGLSAIGIALMHYLSNMHEKPHYGYLSDTLIPWMTQLVYLFFMVSAFGMCCGYYDRTRRGEMQPRQFYSRRYRRILPFFMLLSAIAIATDFSWHALEEGFMNATLMLSLMPVPHTDVIGVGWFLGTVFLFYIFFPFYVYLLDTRRKAWCILLTAYIVNLLCSYYFFTPQYPGMGKDPGRENILFSGVFLICGGLIYLYRDNLYRLAAGRLKHLTGPITILVTIAYFLLLPLCNQHTWASVLGYLIISAVWLMYAVSPDKRWMHNTVMDFLSKYSMEIYLCHMMMFRFLEKMHLENHIPNPDIRYPIICIVGLTLSILFSWVAVKVIDRVTLHLTPKKI